MQEKNTENAIELQSQNKTVAQRLAKDGFKVFPCDDATKHPLTKHGFKDASACPDQIDRWWRRWPNAMPGLPTGAENGVSVVDLDVGKGKDGVAAARNQGIDPADADLVVRTGSGGLHLYFEHRAGVRNRSSKVGLDVRGEGGYVIAPGSVGQVGQYRVERGDLSIAQFLGLTPFPDALVAADREPDPQEPGGDHDIAKLKDALSFVPNDGCYDDWVAILMALHHATGGSEDGLALALGWSAGYDGFSVKEVRKKWRSFGRVKGRLEVTASTLFAEARRHGWDSIRADSFDDDEPETDEIDAFLGIEPDAPKPEDTGGLTFLTPRQCAELPARDYVVKRLIGPGQIGCIFGEPGAGKSLIAPHLAYAVAQGEDAFGLRTKTGSVFYVACEDQDGMAARTTALRADLGEADKLYVVCGCSDLFSPGQIKGKGSTHLEALFKQAKAIRPKLIVIDTLAMAMPGLEENDAAGMNRVVQIGKRLAKSGAAVAFVHHGTKAEGNTPRGHSVFNGALDFAVMVKAADQNGIVRGVVRKNRNGPPDLDIAFRVGSRRVGIDVDGEPVDAPICEPCDPLEGQRGPRLSKPQAAALDHLRDLLGEDRDEVTEAEWRDACTAGRAVSGSEKADTRRTAFRRAACELVRHQQVSFSDGMYRLANRLEDTFEDD